MDGHTLSTVLRTYQLNDSGLCDQVTATSANTGISKPLLAAPMRYVVALAGAATPVVTQPLQITSAKANEAVVEGRFSAGALQAAYKNSWDYDGTVRVELTLQPTDGRLVDSLTLEIPFSAESATLIHANSDRIRAPIAMKIPAGNGVVWNASQVACDDFIHNFCPYIYLGNSVRGLCWFAENDRNWGWNSKTPNLDVVRQDGQVLLRIHLINTPTVIAAPRTITFGLLAAPVKPRLNRGATPNWWRYRYLRDNYQLLGTDINWFGNNSCVRRLPDGGRFEPVVHAGARQQRAVIRSGDRRICAREPCRLPRNIPDAVDGTVRYNLAAITARR